MERPLNVKLSLCREDVSCASPAPHHEHIRESGGVAPHFLNYIEMRDQLHASAALPQGKEPRY
jgi:hypothetical protein